MGSDETVDYQARQDAALARQKIDDHEKLCAQRWSDARDEIKTLRKHLWLAVGALMAIIEFVGPLLKKFLENS